jgi:hypothetical protein
MGYDLQGQPSCHTESIIAHMSRKLDKMKNLVSIRKRRSKLERADNEYENKISLFVINRFEKSIKVLASSSAICEEKKGTIQVLLYEAYMKMLMSFLLYLNLVRKVCLEVKLPLIRTKSSGLNQVLPLVVMRVQEQANPFDFGVIYLNLSLQNQCTIIIPM